MDEKQENVRDVLKALSSQDFLNVGVDQIAYIRPVMMGQKDSVYSVHAADGTQLSVMESYETAMAAVKHNDMHAVTVH